MLEQLAKEVHDLADRIDQIRAKYLVNIGTINLQDAINRVGAAMNGKYFSIDMSCVVNSQRVEVEWSIWDGTNHHKSATLESAFNAFIAEHVPQPANPIRLVQCALAPPEVPIPF